MTRSQVEAVARAIYEAQFAFWHASSDMYQWDDARAARMRPQYRALARAAINAMKPKRAKKG